MIDVKNYQTYYICNYVSNLLTDRFTFLRFLHEFYEGSLPSLIRPFEKYSVLHQFIDFVVRDFFEEQCHEVDLEKRFALVEEHKDSPAAIRELDPYRLPVERALGYYGIEHQTFVEYLEENGKRFVESDADDIYEYLSEITLTGEFPDLTERMAKEAFHILFQDRELLLLFSDMMAAALEHAPELSQDEDASDLLTKKGTLKRQPPPKWARRAVFYRDRGRCVLCRRDLTGLVSLVNQENFDHIVPLAEFGFNDISNLQLLCKECNQKEKSSNRAITSSLYESWYDYE